MDEKKENKQLQYCRFYEAKFPNEEDLVVVEIVNVEENAVYVHLLEYNKIEGMITPNELTKPMQQSVHKALKIGKQEVVRVIRIDQVKGYIDLSKKRVQKQEELLCLDKFAKSKQINSILITVSEKTKTQLEILYEEIVWPLYKICQHPLQAFTQALTEPQIINDLKTSQDNKDALLAQIHLRLTPQTLKIKAEFELSCDEFEGIEAIKQALRSGQEKSKPNCEVRFSIIGSPLYCGQINTQNKTLGLEIIKEALNKVEEVIQKLNGTFKLKTEPKIYGDTKENDMEYIEQNEEVINSDDSQDSEIEGTGVVESGDEEAKNPEEND